MSENIFSQDRINKKVQLTRVSINGEEYFKIHASDQMRPFFMSIVSASNHWMFISSNGGLTAGRKNAQHAIFPYYTDDKITESREITGSKTILQIYRGDKTEIWEPFSDRYEGSYDITRSLYKSVYGNQIIFEEINHDLKLTYSYKWSSSNLYGFVKTSTITNDGNQLRSIDILDGIQNVMPHGVPSDLQNASSNLVDAYKRTELDKDTGMAIFALSAIIVDRAEPSEALKANVAWSVGLDTPLHLLSSLQLRRFRKRQQIHPEVDVKAEKGAYFINQEIMLPAQASKEWKIITNVNQSYSDIVALSEILKSSQDIDHILRSDIALGTKNLIQLNAAADGLQLTADHWRDARHFSNTLFNIMRGGTFDDNYKIENGDFSNYIKKANHNTYEAMISDLDQLPNIFSLTRLKDLAKKTSDPAFKRLALEYLPLKFSRRHGDPSRPWNVFSINTRSEVDGSKILDYQGNWRDIFQNWEALAISYPNFIESMIHKFLNASTFDGYNPYRVTKDGFDWETIEPDDPWSYIGYWGDHQIIYLSKFLEYIETIQPGQLGDLLDKEVFVYANVPYKIKSYADILQNPKDTILFDEEADHHIRSERERIGADGALLKAPDGSIYTVNFLEKILATTLAKLSNFIPEGGIWMNTQRPEWNDANNALVGNGVSMVTLYYLRRFLQLLKEIIISTPTTEVSISSELVHFLSSIHHTLTIHRDLLSGTISDPQRKSLLDQLGHAGSTYRDQIYTSGFSGQKETIKLDHIASFIEIAMDHLEHAIRANRRTDNLYHAYNLMTSSKDRVSISHLSEMLEGQVAVLSSRYLSAQQAIDVLDGMKRSALFREDQYSYLLYPNKELPLFMERNIIPPERVSKSELLSQLIADGDRTVLTKDIKGAYHFNGNFKNADDLKIALEALRDTKYAHKVTLEYQEVLDIFEHMFHHKAFTGRSGTFFGYEGLGSIYWHMVSKLQLAVQECCLTAIRNNETPEIIGKLLEHYYEINAGIGVHKPPTLYGAFPTDPYSHTPSGKGAQQPGMTGQVKEDILSRFGELGVFIVDGQVQFYPCMLRQDEFLKRPTTFNYYTTDGSHQSKVIDKGSLAFTYCQTLIIYKPADQSSIQVIYSNGQTKSFKGSTLSNLASNQVFDRSGEISYIEVNISSKILK